MDEPRFGVADASRRFLRWFVPPAAVAVAGVVMLLFAGHVAGPLERITVVRAMLASKRDFFEDEQVKRILMAEGYQVHVTPFGSGEFMAKQDIDSYHLVFPSGQSVADQIRERRRGKHAVTHRPFFSPVVLSTYRDYAEKLVDAGVATEQTGAPLYYDLSMEGLIGLIDRRKLWSDYGMANRNRIVAQAPDPCRTYSGSVYLAMMAFARYGRPPGSEAEAVDVGRAIKPLFEVQGQHAEDMAPKYFVPEGRTFAPIAVIYEHQFIAHQVRTRERTGQLDSDRVLLYPSAQHQSAPELISQSPEGDEIGRLLMQNPDLRRRAVELGLHVLSPSGTPEVDFAAFLEERAIPVPRSGVGDSEAWLPANQVFTKMIQEVGGCS